MLKDGKIDLLPAVYYTEERAREPVSYTHLEANKLRVPKAFHIMGTLNPDGGIFLTHGIIDLKEFLARVKERGVTVSRCV